VSIGLEYLSTSLTWAVELFHGRWSLICNALSRNRRSELSNSMGIIGTDVATHSSVSTATPTT
jgi:hypothetical protein